MFSTRPTATAPSWATATTAILAGLLLLAVVFRTSAAGFSASTTTAANGWNTGTVALSDNDSGTAMFTVAEDGPLVQGQTLTRCITLSYTGTLTTPVNIRMHTTATGLVAPHLNVTIERGSTAPRDCTGFTPAATDYTGTISALNSSHGDYNSGVATWLPTGPTDTRTYRFTVQVAADAPQGLTGTGTFTWTANSGNPPAATSSQAATWAWGTSKPPVNDVVIWSRAHGLTEIYVDVPWNVGANPTYVTWLQNLRDAAAPYGLTLSALGGDTDWATDPNVPKAWMTGAINTGAFTRIHLDVEPWSTAAWTTQQQTLADQYLTMLDTLNATPGALPIDVDMSPWLAAATTTNGQNWLNQVLTKVGGLSIMSFRDKATGGGNGILDISATTRAAAVTAHVPYRVGVEINANPGCPTCTFYEEGNTGFVTQTRIVHNTLRTTPYYAGIAVEEYREWITQERTTL